ncbi:MAG: hypothetical protein ABIP55_01510 [Tepidisphaeraceae bacterium]
MNRLIAMSMTTVLFTGILLAGAIFTGCVKPPIQGRLDPYPSEQIHFASRELRNDTAVGSPIASRDEEGNILHVEVPIRAATNKELHIDYRVTFKNQNGQTLWKPGWFTKTLAPNIPDSILVNSSGPRAADFQVDFRYAQ